MNEPISSQPIPDPVLFPIPNLTIKLNHQDFLSSKDTHPQLPEPSTQKPLPTEITLDCMSSPAIDATVLRELREIAGEDVEGLIAQVIDCYLEEAPQRLQAINHAVTQGDAKALKMSAHALRSSSLSIGAIFFSQLCETLEAIGRSGTTTDASNLLLQIEAEYKRVENALQLEHPKKEV